MGNTSHKSYDVQQTGIPNTNDGPKPKSQPKPQSGPIEETGKVEGEVLRTVVDAPLRTNAGVDGKEQEERRIQFTSNPYEHPSKSSPTMQFYIIFFQVCAAAIFAVVNARPGGGYEHYDVSGYGDIGIGGHEAYAVSEGGYEGAGGFDAYEGNEIGHEDEGHHEEYIDYHAPAKYHYDYAVHDLHTHDIKSQWETRNGDKVKGEYQLLEPDGSRRIVSYTADKHSGFNAMLPDKERPEKSEPFIPERRPGQVSAGVREEEGGVEEIVEIQALDGLLPC
ncbi:hypothetical protein NQ315_004630 [Exocentrus adspersus]|uniref:Cuticle protein 19 n=1 Tax=Exocentrus adspersus TaxID=1586481 RepID=A0AAV8VNL1_9CUCU|nr:hypothetical protein NQ315_004630 [Exocentrus adspersus]